MRFLPFLGAMGCTYTGADDVAALAEGDADELARTTSAATAALAGDPLDLAGEVAGVGTCVWDWTIAGPRTGAELDAALRFSGCGGTWAGPRGGSLDYAVRSGHVTGTVTDLGDEWSYSLAGSRDATALVTTPGGAQTELDATWTLLSLEGTARLLDPGPFDAELVYDGPDDGVWLLSWSIDADDAASGTLTGPGGTTCFVGGVRGAVTVTCP